MSDAAIACWFLLTTVACWAILLGILVGAGWLIEVLFGWLT